jgi:hypothetical protein
MSVPVKRVQINSPRAFCGVFNNFFLGDAAFDASPIYETFQMTVSISGSYSDGANDYAYSYTGSKTWDRQAIRGSGGGTTFDPNGYNINGIIEFFDGGGSVSPLLPDNDFFTSALTPSLLLFDTVLSFDIGVFLSPQYPAAFFNQGNGGIIESNAIIGTRTEIATGDVVDIIADVVSGPALFANAATPVDPRSIYDTFQCSGGATTLPGAEIVEDASAWTAAKWRDYRGTYTGTYTDGNGITTDIELVLG